MTTKNPLQEALNQKQASLTTTRKHIQLKMETNHQAWQHPQTHLRTMETLLAQSVQMAVHWKERGGCTDITARNTVG